MLEVLSKFICNIIMCITAFYIVKKITNSSEKLFTKRNIFLILVQNIIQTITYNTSFEVASVLIVFMTNIVFTKLIFKLSLEESFVSCGLYTVILFFADVLGLIFIRTQISLEEAKTGNVLPIILNLIIGTLSIFIVNVKSIKNSCNQFYNFSRNKKQTINKIFMALIIFLFITLGYNVSILKEYNLQVIANVLIMMMSAVVTYIFIQDKVKYNQLSDEYDTLFGYVQNFEEWIEKDQLNRHEYKNQLAVLRSATKDETVISKINEILEDNIKLKGDTIYKLKELPKGGIKGLMYYKVAIAQKQNINIEVDVSIKRKSVFKSLSESQTKVLCNLIGIYFDNAIEAASETKKKYVSIEVYEHKEGIKFVISNTFKQSENFDKRNEKGVTTKGKGHGNGLYYANNLISKNNWLEASQDIVDDYYIQNIVIKKLD